MRAEDDFFLTLKYDVLAKAYHNYMIFYKKLTERVRANVFHCSKITSSIITFYSDAQIKMNIATVTRKVYFCSPGNRLKKYHKWKSLVSKFLIIKNV